MLDLDFEHELLRYNKVPSYVPATPSPVLVYLFFFFLILIYWNLYRE